MFLFIIGFRFKHFPSLTNLTGYWPAAASYELGAAPTTKEAQAIADELYANFVSQEVDKVEMIYTKFVSLISSDPTVQTLLPLTPQVRGLCNPNTLPVLDTRQPVDSREAHRPPLAAYMGSRREWVRAVFAATCGKLQGFGLHPVACFDARLSRRCADAAAAHVQMSVGTAGCGRAGWSALRIVARCLSAWHCGVRLQVLAV